MPEIKDGYREEYLGKIAAFFIPSSKVEVVEFVIHSFFIQNYDHAWSCIRNVRGYWMGRADGSYTRFEISFVGKEKIPNLKRFLAKISTQIGEECIYLLTGSNAYRIYPLEITTEADIT